MSGRFVTLAAYIRSLESKQTEPTDLWYKEVVKSFEVLIDQNTAVKANLEEVRDESKKQHLGKLYEQNKALMLEEKVSMLEFDVASARREKDDKEREMTEAAKLHENQLSLMKGEVADAKEAIGAYKAKIEEAEKISNDFMSERSANGEALARANADHSQKKRELEAKNAELQDALGKLEREKAAIAEGKGRIQKICEEKERVIRQTRRDFEDSEKRWKSQSEEDKRKLERTAQALADCNMTNGQLVQQCDSTKKLLITLQQQKASYTEENQQLKVSKDSVIRQRNFDRRFTVSR